MHSLAGFIDFMVEPFFVAVSKHHSAFEPVLANLQANRLLWGGKP